MFSEVFTERELEAECGLMFAPICSTAQHKRPGVLLTNHTPVQTQNTAENELKVTSTPIMVLQRKLHIMRQMSRVACIRETKRLQNINMMQTCIRITNTEHSACYMTVFDENIKHNIGISQQKTIIRHIVLSLP
jgi:hypothetical protein